MMLEGATFGGKQSSTTRTRSTLSEPSKINHYLEAVLPNCVKAYFWWGEVDSTCIFTQGGGGSRRKLNSKQFIGNTAVFSSTMCKFQLFDFQSFGKFNLTTKDEKRKSTKVDNFGSFLDIALTSNTCDNNYFKDLVNDPFSFEVARIRANMSKTEMSVFSGFIYVSF